MMDFTKEELAFLANGGQIWATRSTNEGKWEIVRFSQDGEWIPPNSIQNTKENAEESICALANMEDNQEGLAVHHSIKRPADWPDWYLAAKK